MSYQPQTEAATSRFLNVEENGETLRIHFNDCGQGDETVVLLHGSGPGDAPRDKCGHSGAINHGHTCCYM